MTKALISLLTQPSADPPSAMRHPRLALLETAGIGRKSAVKIGRFMQQKDVHEPGWSPKTLLDLIKHARSNYGRIRLPDLEDVKKGSLKPKA